MVQLHSSLTTSVKQQEGSHQNEVHCKNTLILKYFFTDGLVHGRTDAQRAINVQFYSNPCISLFSIPRQTCFACVLLFLVAWSPYAIVCLWVIPNDPEQITPRLAVLPALFAKSSAMYNPLVYAVSNRQMRKAFLELMGVRKQDSGGPEAVPMQ